jgi:hypothetical protein
LRTFALAGLVIATVGLGPLVAYRPRAGASSAHRPARVASVGTQGSIADQGSFTVLQAGVKVAREVFTIREAPPPDVGYVLEGAVVYPARRVVPILRTDSGGTPIRYEVDEFAGDRRESQLTLSVTRGRGSERVQTRRGESATEFKVAQGTRLLDDDVFAQYYFIARATVRSQPHSSGPVQGMVVPLLVPQREGTVTAPVTVIGNERLDIAGQSRTAIHLRIVPSDGDVRDIWADAQGRLLRIAIPARGLVALRDDVPS